MQLCTTSFQDQAARIESRTWISFSLLKVISFLSQTWLTNSVIKFIRWQSKTDSYAPPTLSIAPTSFSLIPTIFQAAWHVVGNIPSIQNRLIPMQPDIHSIIFIQLTTNHNDDLLHQLFLAPTIYSLRQSSPIGRQFTWELWGTSWYICPWSPMPMSLLLNVPTGGGAFRSSIEQDIHSRVEWKTSFLKV